jgi:hypothetical protein
MQAMSWATSTAVTPFEVLFMFVWSDGAGPVPFVAANHPVMTRLRQAKE